MAELFDPEQSAAQLAATLKGVQAKTAPRAPAPSSEPLFHVREDGAIVDRNGREIRKPLPKREEKK